MFFCVMLFSACIIYVTAIACMCFANKHIIIIINTHRSHMYMDKLQSNLLSDTW